MKLDDLIDGIAADAPAIDMAGLVLDSRELEKGDVFIALAGARRHGLEYARQVAEKGACAILYAPEDEGDRLAVALRLDIPLVRIENLNLELAGIVARFYGHPARHLQVIGLTGTNGKTSCSQFLAQMLPDSAVIGTLGWGAWGNLRTTINTTPDALALQKMLSRLHKDGVRRLAMEVSSHGLEQGRVSGVAFNGAVFTNLSRDHLDYHGSMEAYFQAKLQLFKRPELEFAVINLDDAYSGRIIEALSPRVALWTFSRHEQKATVHARDVRLMATGLSFEVCHGEEKENVHCGLYGDFNADNLLAVITTMLAMGFSLSDAVAAIPGLQTVPGRMQRFGGGDEPLVFVDYAHTPDALEKALSALKQHRHRRLSVVFGCGGDRDRGKRAQMGQVACKLADEVMLTDDNPRTENPDGIIQDILEGCDKDRVNVTRNRNKAIETAITSAASGDCLLVAGKGHEDYQEINDVKHPFSDQKVVEKALRMREL